MVVGCQGLGEGRTGTYCLIDIVSTVQNEGTGTDTGDGCTIVLIYLIPLKYTLKWRQIYVMYTLPQ